MGAMGYFPTYTLGNLYAAQFFDAARAALRTEIHDPGRLHSPSELCERVTGKALSAGPMLAHLGRLHGV